MLSVVCTIHTAWFNLSAEHEAKIQAFYAASSGKSKQSCGIARGIQREFTFTYTDMFPLNPSLKFKRLNDQVFIIVCFNL